jgi:site-specific DNA recombinase
VTPVEYVDDGVSGMLLLGDRPAGARLLVDSQAGKLSEVVVYNVDRLGRGDDARLILDAVFALQSHGVKVTSLTEHMDAKTPNGTFMITVNAGMASYQRATMLERMTLGKERVAAQGKNPGVRTAYGYVTDEEGVFRVSDRPAGDSGMTESEVVRFIFDQTVDRRLSAGRIATLLNAKGVPPPSRGRARSPAALGIWTHGIVSAILCRERYAGTHTMALKGGRRLAIPSPAIVSEETFRAAAVARAENRITLVGHPNEPFPLSNRLTCGVCGRRMSGYAAKRVNADGTKKAHYRYYRCTGLRDGVCAVPSISGLRAEKAVWDACVAFLTDPPTALARYHNPKPDTSTQEALEAEQDGVRQRLAALATERERVISLYARGLVSSADTDPELRRIGTEVDALTARQSALYAEIRQAAPAAPPPDFWGTVEMARKVLERGEVTLDQQKRIIAALVPRIVVTYLREGAVDVPMLTLHAAWGTQVLSLPRPTRQRKRDGN